MKMIEVFSATSIHISQTTRRNIPQDSNIFLWLLLEVFVVQFLSVT